MAATERLAREVLRALSDSELNLILLPTEKCNFRCTYCYEVFAIGRMSPDVIRGVKLLIGGRLPTLRWLSIDWFGGEPLLARNVIEDICGYVCGAVRDTEVTYTSGMTTNGYLLTPPTVDRLYELGVRSYQVTLDGPQKLHDQTRPRVDGNETFDRIWGNLVAIRNSSLDIQVTLRVHLMPSNISAMPSFLMTVKDTFLADSRFRVFLKPIARLGGPHNENIETLQPEERSAILRELQRIIGGGSDDRDKSYVCYASKPNSLVIRANGIVGKCTVALDDPRNQVGRVNANGSLMLDNAAIRPWLRGLQSLDADTLACPLANLAAHHTETSKDARFS